MLELERQLEVLTPYDNFLYALKAKETRRQYPHRLDKFLTFMGLQGTIEEKCNKLFEFSIENNNLPSYIIKFINFQKQRIENKEISLRPTRVLSQLNVGIDEHCFLTVMGSDLLQLFTKMFQ